MKRLFTIIVLVWASISLNAQNAPVSENSDDRMACHRMQCGVRNEISIPDAAGYLVFKCDFHMHTVYADAMVAQGAFIQWNHPGWPDKITEIFDVQKEMIAKGQIHAMEICNHSEWYPKVLDIFDEYHIPMTANTDQHNPSAYYFGRVIRPMSLVLAKEYTLETNLW